MTTHRTKRFVDTVRREPVAFAVVWLITFSAFFTALYTIGIVPTLLSDTASGDTDPVVTVAEDPTTTVVPYSGDDAPMRIIIDRIGVDSSINNPASRDITALDQALQSGVVHYPGSGDLEDTSNMFLFGHSSHLRVVQNKAYQAFNDIEDLEVGDIVRVQSRDKEYIYKVSSVVLVDADDAWVELSTSEKKLTLSTCNNFGTKQDRYVVEADFFGSYALDNSSA